MHSEGIVTFEKKDIHQENCVIILQQLRRAINV